MKNQILCLLLFQLSFSTLSAQFTDNFSDGDFTANPVWLPDAAGNWAIENNQLRSNSAMTNANFYISTASGKALNAQWEFFVNLKFNTSGANYVDIYLISEQGNLQSVLNRGYLIRIGGTLDEISLYKIDGLTLSLLIDGTDGITNSSNTTVKIKVSRDANNLWTLQRDLSGSGMNYFTEGTVTDNSFSSSNFFGIRIQQSTASFFNKHFFDDFQVGDIILDTTPPTVLGATILSANQLDILFSENITNASAQNTANYSVNNGLGNPTHALKDGTNQALVHLTFGNNFMSGLENTLTVQNVSDLAGNVMNPQNLKFTFIQTFSPQYHELIISEIMADPRGNAQPLNPLPDAEFIEVYNRSSKVLNLENCSFSDQSSSIILPKQNINSDEFIILCDNSKITDFQPFGRVIGLSGFPALTNSGERLTLKNAAGNLLFTLHYTDVWYQNSSKADGGWTLEMIDLNNPCGEASNWTASENARGGTAGKANSVAASKQDLTSPKLIRADALDNQNLRLTFNEKMEEASLLNGIYQIDKGISVQSIITESPDLKRLTLQINPPLQAKTLYTISLSGMRDCSENLIKEGDNSLSFGLVEQGDSLDILLNEILFNPYPNGSDFVEIYNNSDKFINLKDWKLANITEGIIANQTIISTEDFVLKPKSYVVFTENTIHIKSNYPQAKEEVFLELNALPSYPDDEGVFILINNQSRVVERFDYKNDFHFALLDDKEGVSLERISLNLPTNNKNSWQSAASSVGYATPGYLNSQSQKESSNFGTMVINPKIFTPDGDGNQDFTSIEYEFAQSGNVMDILIYDNRGREIKRLAQNQFLGTEKGNIIWDGTDGNNNKAKTGYYLIYIKIFDSAGKEQTFKETVVLGARF